MKKLQKKLTILFYELAAAVLLLVFSLVFLSVKLYPGLILLSKNLFGMTRVVCNCTSFISLSKNPTLFASYILSAIVIGLFFTHIAIKSLKLKRETSKFTKSILADATRASFKLSRSAKRVNLHGKVVEIKSARPIVFCFGFLKPKICISSGLIKKLNQEELQTVLLHEKLHLMRREPMKMYIIKLAQTTMWFIPGIRSLAKKYKTFSELLADSFATNNFSYKTPLARALYKVMNFKEHARLFDNLALTQFSTITDERVLALSSASYAPREKTFGKEFIASIFSIVFILAVAYNMLFSPSKTLAHTTEIQCKEIFSHTESICKEKSGASCEETYFLESPLCQ